MSKKTKFYTFFQNNSGGYFVNDDKYGVCEIVIIEALDYSDAYLKLLSIGDKVDEFWDFCECCGERWLDWDIPNGEDEPKVCNIPIKEFKGDDFMERCFVHYSNGSIKEYIFADDADYENWIDWEKSLEKVYLHPDTEDKKETLRIIRNRLIMGEIRIKKI